MAGRAPLYPPKGWAQPLNHVITAVCDRATPLPEPEEHDGKQFDHELRGSLRDVITEVVQSEGLKGKQTAYTDRLVAAGVVYNDSKPAKPRWLAVYTELSVDDGVRADSIARGRKNRGNKASRKKRRTQAKQTGAGSAGATDKVEQGLTGPERQEVVRRGLRDENGMTELERVLKDNRELEERLRRTEAERDDFMQEYQRGVEPIKHENTELLATVALLLEGGEAAERLKAVYKLGKQRHPGPPDWSRG